MYAGLPLRQGLERIQKMVRCPRTAEKAELESVDCLRCDQRSVRHSASLFAVRDTRAKAAQTAAELRTWSLLPTSAPVAKDSGQLNAKPMLLAPLSWHHPLWAPQCIHLDALVLQEDNSSFTSAAGDFPFYAIRICQDRRAQCRATWRRGQTAAGKRCSTFPRKL